MQILESEAVVLNALPFKEHERILTLFAPMGLLKLITTVKNSRGSGMALTSPLTHGEYHFTQGRKELHRMTDGSIICQHLGIRSSYAAWIAAEKMIRAILISQWPGKAAPQLFLLFTHILNFLPKSFQPEVLSTAFFLKIMRHEGILQLNAHCQASLRFAGECYAEQEPPKGAISFSQTEEELLALLASSRSLREINEQHISPSFLQKVELLFEQAFNELATL